MMDATAGEIEEDLKGIDLEKLKEKEYVPQLFEDDNFEFKVMQPTLQGGTFIYVVKGVDK